MDSQVTDYPAEMVSSLLHIPNTCTAPVPDVSCLVAGEILVWYPGCTLTQLRDSPLGKERMWQDQDWYDQKNYSAEPGYYAVQLRVPDSSRKNWLEQQALLVKSSMSLKPTPVAVAALALLLHLKENGNDLLQDAWCRCLEEGAQCSRVVLTVYKGRVHVNHDWDGYRRDILWLAAARKF